MFGLIASFHSFTWTGFFMQIGIGFAPSVLAAVWGARRAIPGPRGNIILMASFTGITFTTITFCGFPKVEIGPWIIIIPIAAGAFVSYALARFLAR